MRKRKSNDIMGYRKDGTPFTYREWDLEYSFAIPKDADARFEEICALAPVNEWIKRNDIDDFKLKLGEIVARHRNRFEDVNANSQRALVPLPPSLASHSSKTKRSTADLPYFARIKDCLTSLRQAEKALTMVAERFRLIDIEHVDCAIAAASLLPDNPLRGSNAWDLTVRLAHMKHFVAVLASATKLATGVSDEQRARGRPGYNYIQPAHELVVLWEAISGTQIVTPRGSATGRGRRQEFTQPSSEFVRIGLQMIDRTVTPQEVTTAIKNIMTLRKKMAENPLIFVVDD